MKSLCAWCGKEIGPVDTADGQPISHGICRSCMIDIEFDTIKFAEYLNGFDFPLLLVDGEGIIRDSNRIAQQVLEQTGEEIRNLPGGDILRCVYADLPEGCGNTRHCAACTIRNTVQNTHRTGESAKSVKATQYLKTKEGLQMMEIFISTEKIGERVLLKLEEMNPAPDS